MNNHQNRGKGPAPSPSNGEPESQFDDFGATELFCDKCRVATPVREKLLLILPDGDLYEYICSRCGNSVGKKKTSTPIGLR
jgi:hypothetical protein